MGNEAFIITVKETTYGNSVITDRDYDIGENSIPIGESHPTQTRQEFP